MLKSPGSRDTSVFGLRVAGGELGLPGLLTIEHSLSGSLKPGLPLPIGWRPVSCHPAPVIGLGPSPPFAGLCWLLPLRASTFPTVVRTSNDRIPEVGTVVSAGL